MSDIVLEPPKTQYPVDENGIEIRPGYRKPFDSERARAAQLLSARARSNNALAAKLERDSRVIIEVLNQVRELLKSRKSRSKSPTISPRPVNKNRSQVKPEGVAPITNREVSDCKPVQGDQSSKT